MSTVSAQAIEDSLKQCMDPEVPLNIVEMGLIYGIDVTENNDVNIKMTMTTQGCPLHQTLVADAIENGESCCIITWGMGVVMHQTAGASPGSLIAGAGLRPRCL